MKKNNSPVLRRCVSCRELTDRKHLFKITNDRDQGLLIGGGMGRSAYICQTSICLLNAEKKKRLQKSLRCKVEETIFEILQKQLKICKESRSEAK